MFEDFSGKRRARDRKRFGISMIASAAIYLTLFGSAVLASAAVRKIVQEERLVQVEFKLPPEPPPPPPPAPEVNKPNKPVSTEAARAKVVRPELKAPDAIPDEKPEESSEALVEAPAPGEGQEGFLTGVVGGTGTAAEAPNPPAPPPPPPKPRVVKPSAPIRNADTLMPEYPRSARRAGLEGTVVARVYVKADGTIGKVEILEGPEVFHESVRDALMTWRYKPAQLSDGSAVADTHIVRIPFSLQ